MNKNHCCKEKPLLWEKPQLLLHKATSSIQNHNYYTIEQLLDKTTTTGQGCNVAAHGDTIPAEIVSRRWVGNFTLANLRPTCDTIPAGIVSLALGVPTATIGIKKSMFAIRPHESRIRFLWNVHPLALGVSATTILNLWKLLKCRTYFNLVKWLKNWNYWNLFQYLFQYIEIFNYP